MLQQIGSAANLTISGDGWTDIVYNHIYGLTVLRPDPLFLRGHLSPSEALIGAEHVTGVTLKEIDSIGPFRFNAVTGDKESKMHAAGKIIGDRYPWILSIGCIAHLI